MEEVEEILQKVWFGENRDIEENKERKELKKEEKKV